LEKNSKIKKDLMQDTQDFRWWQIAIKMQASMIYLNKKIFFHQFNSTNLLDQ
jgi:hypothetical protein